MSRRAPRPFALALSALTDRLAPASTLARVQGVWEAAAGVGVAAACRPVAEREGVLTIVCSEAVWAQELDLMGEELMGRVNAALGEQLVHKVRCRVG
jgi:predicted nucleic acid-binding Zn ribbon protein